MSRPAVVELHDVTVRRQRREIVSHVSWTVGEGQRWVVLGPNGAGKTTLVRIASTYLMPSSGSVDVLGHRVGRTDVATLRPRIGYLSPSLATMVPRELTPRQIVDAAQAGAVLPWYIDPGRIDRDRTTRALADAGMADARDAPIETFSSGEQLRVQLARALVTDPALLLLDEPMASLDIGGREALVATLSRVASGSIGAIVVVLHRVEDIPPGFTHALLMRDARVVTAGPIDEVLTDQSMSSTFGIPLHIRKVGDRLATMGTPGTPSV